MLEKVTRFVSQAFYVARQLPAVLAGVSAALAAGLPELLEALPDEWNVDEPVAKYASVVLTLLAVAAAGVKFLMPAPRGAQFVPANDSEALDSYVEPSSPVPGTHDPAADDEHGE